MTTSSTTNPKILKAGKELRDYKKNHVRSLCPLCNRDMKYVESKNQVVDHDHNTGAIRDVLCRNCNGLEGKIHNLCVRAGKHIKKEDYLDNLIDYWLWHEIHVSNTYYPGCKVVNGKVIKPKKTRRKRKWRSKK